MVWNSEMSESVYGYPIALDNDLASSLMQRRCTVSASLAILIWDYFITLDDEIGFVWKYPFNCIKAIYIIGRYMPLIVQSLNVYFVTSSMLTDISADDIWPCIAWWYFLVISMTVFLMCLDCVLMLRIYALYKKDKRIAALLVSTIVLMGIAQVAVSHRFVLTLSFDRICDSTSTYPHVKWLAILIWVVQIMIGMLLLSQRRLMLIGGRILTVVNRDSVAVLGIICAFIAFEISYSSINHNYKVHVVVIVPLSVISLVCCRSILNLLTLNPNENGEIHTDTCILTDFTSPD